MLPDYYADLLREQQEKDATQRRQQRGATNPTYFDDTFDLIEDSFYPENSVLTQNYDKINQDSWYNKFYFTGADVRFYIDQIGEIDGVIACQFSLTHTKAPMYGFASTYFDFVAPGQIIVRGAITLAFQYSDYLSVGIVQAGTFVGDSCITRSSKFQDISERGSTEFTSESSAGNLSASADLQSLSPGVKDELTGSNLTYNEWMNRFFQSNTFQLYAKHMAIAFGDVFQRNEIFKHAKTELYSATELGWTDPGRVTLTDAKTWTQDSMSKGGGATDLAATEENKFYGPGASTMADLGVGRNGRLHLDNSELSPFLGDKIPKFLPGVDAMDSIVRNITPGSFAVQLEKMIRKALETGVTSPPWGGYFKGDINTAVINAMYSDCVSDCQAFMDYGAAVKYTTTATKDGTGKAKNINDFERELEEDLRSRLNVGRQTLTEIDETGAMTEKSKAQDIGATYTPKGSTASGRQGGAGSKDKSKDPNYEMSEVFGYDSDPQIEACAVVTNPYVIGRRKIGRLDMIDRHVPMIILKNGRMMNAKSSIIKQGIDLFIQYGHSCRNDKGKPLPLEERVADKTWGIHVIHDLHFTTTKSIIGPTGAVIAEQHDFVASRLDKTLLVAPNLDHGIKIYTNYFKREAKEGASENDLSPISEDLK